MDWKQNWSICYKATASALWDSVDMGAAGGAAHRGLFLYMRPFRKQKLTSDIPQDSYKEEEVTRGSGCAHEKIGWGGLSSQEKKISTELTCLKMSELKF